ncbi:MAG: nucleoside triphosphate pyrophosphohydrolase [Solirubrobacterales bacterium]|nr:nucleoside triphosphate pyrophosphohydrolase [Solirubrobacterales bacterium]
MSEGDALESLARLDAITRRLRRECPWDREQDARSIVPHTVEEAYELADAAQRDDPEGMVDELGDVLFQVMFLSLLLEERGLGDLEAVAESLSAKLIRRHPHVFGEADADSSAEVLESWERIKREVEGREGEDPFASIAGNLPSLTYARKVLRRVDPGGSSSADKPGGPGGDPQEREQAEREVGELLMEAVVLSRRLGVDPELALRAATDRLKDSAL